MIIAAGNDFDELLRQLLFVNSIKIFSPLAKVL
jgi:hypothetical protein